MNEIFPLEQAAEAYKLMMSGKARFTSTPTISEIGTCLPLSLNFEGKA
jgi:hypothetical protein